MTPTGWHRHLSTPLSPTTARAIRIHLTLLPIYIVMTYAWIMWAVNVGVPGNLDRSGRVKGHDFVHFYVLGEIARDRAVNELYSYDAQGARIDRIAPGVHARFLPAHPPQTALFFAPLAALPYPTAVAAWLALSACLYAWSGWALWSRLPALHAHGVAVLLLAIAFPGFYAVIVAGQTSAFALAWFTLGYLALRANRPWFAGLALGMLAYKPPLGVLVPLFLLVVRQYRAVASAAIAAALQFLAGGLYFGGGVAEYVANFSAVANSGTLLEQEPHLMHSLRAFFTLLVPWRSTAEAAYLVSAVLVVALLVRAWTRPATLEQRYAWLLAGTVLVSPHLYSYDLLMLVPAYLVFAADAVHDHGRLTWPLLYASYCAPVLTALTKLIGAQMSVPILAALLARTGLGRSHSTS